jgi:molecular chaperone GrpE
MTKQTKHTSEKTAEKDADGTPAEGAAAPQAAPETGAEASAAAPANDNASEVIARLELERSELKDRLLRTLADFENLRRRTEREVADARSYAITRFAGDMLGVADNMARALAAIPAEARDGADATLKALVEGAELTEREMLRALEKHGVKKIDPKGERFDPNFHQAMFEIPDPSVPGGTVAQVVQVGYSIGDRVLRPAMVGVARGGPKPGSQSTGAQSTGAQSTGAESAGADPGGTVDKSA